MLTSNLDAIVKFSWTIVLPCTLWAHRWLQTCIFDKHWPHCFTQLVSTSRTAECRRRPIRLSLKSRHSPFEGNLLFGNCEERRAKPWVHPQGTQPQPVPLSSSSSWDDPRRLTGCFTSSYYPSPIPYRVLATLLELSEGHPPGRGCKKQKYNILQERMTLWRLKCSSFRQSLWHRCFILPHS